MKKSYFQALLILGMYLGANWYSNYSHNQFCAQLGAQLEESGEMYAPANSCGFLTKGE